jgi:hypothetical protein
MGGTEHFDNISVPLLIASLKILDMALMSSSQNFRASSRFKIPGIGFVGIHSPILSMADVQENWRQRAAALPFQLDLPDFENPTYTLLEAGNADGALRAEALAMKPDTFELMESVGRKVALTAMGTNDHRDVFYDHKILTLAVSLGRLKHASAFSAADIANHGTTLVITHKL